MTSIYESGLSLYKPKPILENASVARNLRSSVSTRLLDDLLQELAPKRDTTNAAVTALEPKDPDVGQDKEASRRKHVISKLQKIVLLHTTSKRELTDRKQIDERHNEGTFLVQRLTDVETKSCVSRANSRPSIKLTKKIKALSKSLSSFSKFKSNLSTGNLHDDKTWNHDISHNQGKVESMTTDSCNPSADEKASRFSLLKRVQSLPQLGTDSDQSCFSTNYSLDFQVDTVHADEESLGDFVDNVKSLESSNSRTSGSSASDDDHRVVGTARHSKSSTPKMDYHHSPTIFVAHHRINLGSDHNTCRQEMKVRSQNGRSSSRSGRTLSSTDGRSGSQKRSQSCKRRAREHELVRHNESIRALIDVLTADIPSHRQEQGHLKAAVDRRPRTKLCLHNSVRGSSLPNLQTFYDESTLRCLSGSKQNATWGFVAKKDVTRHLSLHKRGTLKSKNRSIQDLRHFEDEVNSWHSPEGKQQPSCKLNGSTTRQSSMHSPKLRSVKSVTHRSVPNLQFPKDDTSAGGAYVQSRNEEWQFDQDNKKKKRSPLRSSRHRSVKSLTSRSLPNLQFLSDHTNSGDQFNDSRNTTWQVDVHAKEARPSSMRSSRHQSVKLLTNPSRPDLHFADDEISSAESRNETWQVDMHARKTKRSFLHSARHRCVKSLTNRSLPNLQFPNDHINSCDGSDESRHTNWQDDVDTRRARPPSMRSLRYQSVKLLTNRSLPNLEFPNDDTSASGAPGKSRNATWQVDVDTSNTSRSFRHSERNGSFTSRANRSLPNLQFPTDDSNSGGMSGKSRNAIRQMDVNDSKRRRSSRHSARNGSFTSRVNRSLPDLQFPNNGSNPGGMSNKSLHAIRNMDVNDSKRRRSSRHSARNRSLTSRANRSLPNLQFPNNDSNSVGMSNKSLHAIRNMDVNDSKRRRSSRHSVRNESVMSSANHSLPNLHLCDHETSSGNAFEGHRNAIWHRDVDKTRLSSLRSPRFQSVKSLEYQSFPNIPFIHADVNSGSGREIQDSNRNSTVQNRELSPRIQSQNPSQHQSLPSLHATDDGVCNEATTTTATTTRDLWNDGESPTFVSRVPHSSSLSSSSSSCLFRDQSLLDSTQPTPTDKDSDPRKFEATLHASSLDLLVNERPRSKRRFIKLLGHGSLTDLECFEGIHSRDLWTESQNVTWDLDAKRERIKSRNQIKKTEENQNLPNLPHVECEDMNGTRSGETGTTNVSLLSKKRLSLRSLLLSGARSSMLHNAEQGQQTASESCPSLEALIRVG